jgi:NitT/TauT family transport system ATP-binding protein
MSPEVEVPMIQFAGVGKSYGNGQAVLDGLDLVVLKREFVTFIGPSGCGKSTVLKLISGLTPPTAGTISVD